MSAFHRLTTVVRRDDAGNNVHETWFNKANIFLPDITHMRNVRNEYGKELTLVMLNNLRCHAHF